ncbi:MAG: ABC transporter ATP-binding protein [Firmicutes bacterium]|uniref:ABC transporter ATP-binding protein n=1 Tax=Candidatus Scatoplasma merdavium TaxID=2840932 RepID=A0A9D9GRB3_9BACL|nr:ABC transporter ATP-binding protein [Candidatus Scatoplasma merdavium]
MISIVNVSKSFGNNKAVNSLSLDIKNGEIFGLLGPNGAGKSTTLKMITGILKPDNGDVLIDGNSIVTNSIEAKMNFGFVPDSPNMFLGMTGENYLSFIASCYRIEKSKAMERAIELSKKFEIFDNLHEVIANYSHGMRQKLFICGSLLHNPNNWILDEPLTGLDPEAAFQVKNTMQEMANESKSILFSTHVLDVAERVCDRIGIIDKGQLLFVGTLEELREKQHEENTNLESLFLELTKND